MTTDGENTASVSLPVLSAPGNQRTIKKSRTAKWRAAVLIAVHVAIIAHLIQWLVTGMTVSPVEPSESMETLEQGFVNAGFIFFVVAILSTIIFGRFFCGWGCHVVALQDLCSVMLGKVGIRPKPFRTRLLVWTPVVLAFYMFLWPNFKRWVVFPILEAFDEPRPYFLKDVAVIERFQNELIVDDFWATFPDWYIAIPFLFVCGFVAVYFLGSKGFCTYGCPYGGIFGPVDRIAPVRIRVNDNCEGCGHCTAVCTSNVRVHDEVRDYGMVVDPGCMKCMDCVNVCPNDALYVGLGRPAVLAGMVEHTDPVKKKKAEHAKKQREGRYDLTIGGEIVVAIVLFLLFFGYRGMFDRIPLLMAIAMAGVVAYMLMLLARMVTRPSVRLHNWQFKKTGRWTVAGLLFAAITLGLTGLAGWSAHARYHRWQGELAFAKLSIPVDIAFRPDFQASDEHEAIARHALESYRRGGSIRNGGFGWQLPPDLLVRTAYMHLLLGEWDLAEAELQEVITRGNPRDGLIDQLVQVMSRRGASQDEVIATMQRAVELHDDLPTTTFRLVGDARSRGDDSTADALLASIEDESVQGRLLLARAASIEQRPDDIQRHLDAALEIARGRHGSPALELNVAEPQAALGNRDAAIETLDAITSRDDLTASEKTSIASFSASLGRLEHARELAKAAADIDPRSARTWSSLMSLFAGLEMRDEFVHAKERVTHLTRHSAWETNGLGNLLNQLAGRTGDQGLLDESLERLRRATAIEPNSSVLWMDLARIEFSRGNAAESAEAIERAAILADRSGFVAERAAELLTFLARSAPTPEQSQIWSESAARWRETAASRYESQG